MQIAMGAATAILNGEYTQTILAVHQELSVRSTPTCLPGQGGGLTRGDAADDRQRSGMPSGRAPSPIDEMERPNLSETVVEQLAEDEFPDAFPGLILSHLLTFTTRDQIASAISVLQAIGASGGELAYVRMIKCGEGLKHELRLCGLGPRQARLLSEGLAALPGVAGATIEHQLLRR